MEPLKGAALTVAVSAALASVRALASEGSLLQVGAEDSGEIMSKIPAWQ